MVDFIIAGAGKSGTRTLLHYLNEHQDICMANYAEPKYFTNVKKGLLHSSSGNYTKGPEWYNGLFEVPDKIKGDCSVLYFTSPDAPELIHKHAPKVKLVFLLRNPIDRFYSHYWQEIKTGNIPNQSLESMLERNDEKLVRYYANSYYKRNINLFIKYFQRDQIFILLAEEFYKDPLVELNRLYEFLGVSRISQVEVIIKNKAAIPKSRMIHSTIRTMSLLGRRMRFLLPRIVQKKLSKNLHLVRVKNMKSNSYSEMSNKIRASLYDQFNEDIEFIKDFTNNDEIDWK